MKVLNIGCKEGANDPYKVIGEDIELFHMDIDENNEPDYLHDITTPVSEDLIGAFDVVFASHLIEHLPRYGLTQAMNNIIDMTKDLIYIYVPRLEWICQQILMGNESMAIQAALFGGQANEWDFHRTGYSINALKTIAGAWGLKVVQAGYSPFGIIDQDGKIETAYQNVIVCRKPEAENGNIQ